MYLTERYSPMYEALEILFNILLIPDKRSKTSNYFAVIFIFNLLSLVSENYLPYYFKTSLELNQTESVCLTQFITLSFTKFILGVFVWGVFVRGFCQGVYVWGVFVLSPMFDFLKNSIAYVRICSQASYA